MRIKNLLHTTGAAALLAMSVQPASYAQQTAETRVVLEEITVTARKVEENLMTVPVAVTAFTAKDIEAIGMKEMNDVSNFTPSFHFVNMQGGSGRNDRSSNSLVFRGLYLNSNAGITAGGQLFIDGAPVLGAQAPSVTEVERIEVLKGPQSAYFGRSTFVGAINFVSRDPSMTTYKGKVSAEYSQYGSNEETLSFEGPLLEDKLAARVSVRHYALGGQYTNAADTSQKLGARSTNSVSTTILAKPTDSLKIKAFINYFEDRDGPPAQGTLKADNFNCNFQAAGAPAGSRAAQGYYCGQIPTAQQIPARIISGDYTMTPYLQAAAFGNVPQRWTIFDPSFNKEFGTKRHAFQSNVKVEYETEGGYTISSLTAYHHDQAQTPIDLNYRDSHDQVNPFFATNPAVLPYKNFMQVVQSLQKDYSQEIRVTSNPKERFRFTAGGNYVAAYSPGGPVFGNTGTGPAFSSAITRSKYQTPALFGGLYFDILTDLTLSGEARYQWDRVKQSPIVGTAGTYLGGAAAATLANTFKSFSPRVSLDWKYAPDSTAYALWSRGYRPGGFNSVLATSPANVLAALSAQVPNAGLAYQQEQLDNFELGLKSSFLDGRARTTLAVYYDKWKNGQNGQTISLFIPASGTTPAATNNINLTTNTGQATLKGIEFEGQFQVTNEFKLSATAALNATAIKQFVCADCFQVYGNAYGNTLPGILGTYAQQPGKNHLPAVPKWTWTLSPEYTNHLSGDFDWFARMDYRHMGKIFIDFSNEAWIGASDTINLHLGVRNQNLTIEAFVNNVTQDGTMTSGGVGTDLFFFQSTTPRNEIRFSLPLKRAFGARASYSF